MTPRLTILLVAAAFAVGCSQNGASQAPAGGPAGGASATVSAARSSGEPTANAAPAGSSSSSGAAGTNAAPAEAKPQFREVTIPSGTALSIKLANTVASDKSKVEETVRGS